MQSPGQQTRELQRDLLRTPTLVEFEHFRAAVPRAPGFKETAAKRVRLDITVATSEMDRGVLDHMMPLSSTCCATAVVHRNARSPERLRTSRLKARSRSALAQELNDVSVVFADDEYGVWTSSACEKTVIKG
jgi:chemosensory pili system protein ChpA (sensor histidine kinase/response regulator)